MKLCGKKLGKPKPEYAVIPRSDGDIVFVCEAVLDYTEFDQLCPEPMPPVVVHRDGRRLSDINDKRFQQAVIEHGARRGNWMILASLKATSELEWETVNLQDPTTWNNWKTELAESFTNFEINAIVGAVLRANNMDEERMKEARESFLRGQAQASSTSNFPTEEVPIMPSGEPVNASESDLGTSGTT